MRASAVVKCQSAFACLALRNFADLDAVLNLNLNLRCAIQCAQALLPGICLRRRWLLIHLVMELMKSLAGVDIPHVPYRGDGPAMVDVIGGRVAMMFGTIPSAMPHVRDGRVRVPAVSSAAWHMTLPDVPTVAEADVPGFEAVGLYGLLAPLATPESAIARYTSEVASVLGRPALRARMQAIGVDPAPGSPATFAAFVERDRARWTQPVRSVGIRPD